MQNNSPAAKYTDALRMPMAQRAPAAWTGQLRVPPAPSLSLAPADLRILIVNEDMRSADSLKRTLSDLGYNTTFTAYSAKRALVAADDFSPSVALLDLELPDMTGYQLAHKLRAHSHRHVRRLSLVAVSESDIFGTTELVRAAGFVGHLTKPVRPLELNGLLRGLWGN